MCLSPSCRKISSNGVTRVIHYPCGHCLECVKALQRDWSTRIVEESKQWKYMLFFTLKYSNSRVPHMDIILTKEQYEFVKERFSKLPPSYDFKYVDDPRYEYCRCDCFRPVGDLYFGYSLVCDKSDIQNFWKRVRRRLELLTGNDVPLKYFTCSEYGPTTLRPHYHGVVMCDLHPSILQSVMFDVWADIASEPGLERMCFSSSLAENKESCARYCSKYCCKPAAFEHPLVYLGIIPKPFRLVSKGMGIDFANTVLKRQFNDLLEEYKIKPQIIDNVKHFVFNPSLLQSCNLPDEFYSRLKALFVKPTQVGDKIYNVPFPRYWRDRLFPVRYVARDVFNSDTNCIETKWSLRKDCDNPLSLGYARYIERQIYEDYCTRVCELQALNPALSLDECAIRISAMDTQDIRKREHELLSNFYKFYSKSKVK